MIDVLNDIHFFGGLPLWPDVSCDGLLSYLTIGCCSVSECYSYYNLGLPLFPGFSFLSFFSLFSLFYLLGLRDTNARLFCLADSISS